MYNLGDIITSQSNRGSCEACTYVGGIIGSGGPIEYAYNKGNLKINTSQSSYDNTYVGGIIGSGDVSNSYNNGAINVNCEIIPVGTTYLTTSYIGGVSGLSNSIKDCYNTGTIRNNYKTNYIEKSLRVGGVSGSCGNIQSSYNTGDVYSVDKGSVRGGSYVGGVVGYGQTLSDVYNQGDIKNDNGQLTTNSYSYVSGIAAYCDSITHTYNSGNISNIVK